MEWTREMREVAAELAERYVRYGEGCEEACERCPYAERCAAEGGCWGCAAWEEGMGDDL